MICGQLPLCALDVSQWASCSSVAAIILDVSQRASVTVPTRATTLDWVINCVKHMMNNNVQRTSWKPEATIAVTEVLYMWRRTLYSSAFVTECQPEWMQVGGSPDIDPWFCPDFWPHQWLEPPRGCHNRCCCHHCHQTALVSALLFKSPVISSKYFSLSMMTKRISLFEI